MEYKYSNALDIFGLKSNVLKDYENYVRFMHAKARELRIGARPVEVCPICGTAESSEAHLIHGWSFQQCSQCTHVYNALQIDPERLTDYYMETAGKFSYAATYIDDEDAQRIRQESAATPKVDYISGFKEGHRTWIDIATGNADILYIARDQGFEVKGIELNEGLIEYAKRVYDIDVYGGTLLDYAKDYPQEKWDIVTFIGILDILPDAITYLKTARRMQKPGGLMAVNVPHYNSLTRTIQRAYSNRVARHAFPNLFHLFTEESITKALEIAGYRPLGIWFYGMDIYELINNLHLESYPFRGSALEARLMELVNDLQAVIDQKKSSDEFLLVAQAV
jgi:ubiquinone/menaquinone biosynthesis C-methylase UbiE